MKVIHVISDLRTGGAEIMCEALTYELIKNNIEVIVISLYDCDTPITKRFIDAGVKVEFLGKKPGMDLSIIKKICKIFKREKPDVVHSHISAQKYAMIAAWLSRVPLRVHTVHSVADKELSRVDRFLAKIFYKRHNVVPVALSSRVQDTVTELYKLSPDKVPVIFNGINLSNCIKKESYDISNTVKILHIGSFSEVKNHKGLIDAFKIFHATVPNSKLSLIGHGVLFDEIKQYVCNCGLEDCVEFLGIQANVYPFINEADIFVLPSLYEGIPMTLIEAMGSGMPIVASNVGGIPDMLVNEESAILTEVDSQAVADAFIRLSQDISLREKLGHNALACSENFSSEIMARKYIEIYELKEI